MRRFALFLTGDASQADDLVSETFVRAWAAQGRISAPSVRAYLLAITKNLHRDQWRRERRWLPLDERAPAPGPGPEERAEHALRLTGVRRAFGRIAPGDRRALLLHAVAGLTYLEIAARLGITIAAVKSRIFRARAALTGAYSAGPRSGGST